MLLLERNIDGTRVFKQDAPTTRRRDVFPLSLVFTQSLTWRLSSLALTIICFPERGYSDESVFRFLFYYGLQTENAAKLNEHCIAAATASQQR